VTTPGDPGASPEHGGPGGQPEPPAWNRPGDQPPAWGAPPPGGQYPPAGPPGQPPPGGQWPGAEPSPPGAGWSAQAPTGRWRDQPQQQPGWAGAPQSGSWQPPSQYGGVPTTRPTNTLAIISLIASLVWLCGAGSIAAVILGFLARQQIRQRNEGGSGLALAGMIIGGVGIVVTLIWIIVVVATGTTDTSTVY
jgi:Domain of unknown function (DUF4190)